ncbi:pyridoxal-dependent decarboxylase [Xylariales sp. PMI_506]|nr:pyridoxal-dependent decarboxylase [Xylariales sp. PMI_506]
MDAFKEESYHRIRSLVAKRTAARSAILPPQAQIAKARDALPKPTDPGYMKGRGLSDTVDHLINDIAPALNSQNLTGHYYGFVTGSTLTIGEVADNIVSAFDQNLHVHLPTQHIATEVEDAALKMLIGLLDLGDPSSWEGRVITTGATASNILGLGCGREAVIQAKLPEGGPSVGELGLLGACLQAGVKEVQVLTSLGHSSLTKAAAVVGVGRACVKELPYSDEEPWRLNIDAVEQELQREGVASIISVSAGEINTGKFATRGIEDMRRLRALADRHGAWIHVDGAFGIFARALPAADATFARQRSLAEGIELADSITGDAHKLLNVPYDCGFFFTRRASSLLAWCQNANAAYLAAPPSAPVVNGANGINGAAPAPAGPKIQSPMNMGLENSRRFRALPVYATLVCEGSERISEMVGRMVRLARGVAALVHESEDYELLPAGGQATVDDTGIVVLFRAKDEALNAKLVDTINGQGEWYVSGTEWEGRKAARLAASSWRISPQEDIAHIQHQLTVLAREHKLASR